METQSQEMDEGTRKRISVIKRDKHDKKSKVSAQCKEAFKEIDYFGQKVNIKWDGKDEFKTSFGALVSLGLMLLLLAYTAYRLFYLVHRYNPTVTKTTLIRSVDEEIDFRPQDFGFDFAFGLGVPLDPTVGYFTLNYLTQVVNGTQRIKTRNPINFTTCGTTYFNYSNQ